MRTGDIACLDRELLPELCDKSSVITISPKDSTVAYQVWALTVGRETGRPGWVKLHPTHSQRYHVGGEAPPITIHVSIVGWLAAEQHFHTTY